VEQDISLLQDILGEIEETNEQTGHAGLKKPDVILAMFRLKTCLAGLTFFNYSPVL